MPRTKQTIRKSAYEELLGTKYVPSEKRKVDTSGEDDPTSDDEVQDNPTRDDEVQDDPTSDDDVRDIDDPIKTFSGATRKSEKPVSAKKQNELWEAIHTQSKDSDTPDSPTASPSVGSVEKGKLPAVVNPLMDDDLVDPNAVPSAGQGSNVPDDPINVPEVVLPSSSSDLAPDLDFYLGESSPVPTTESATLESPTQSSFAQTTTTESRHQTENPDDENINNPPPGGPPGGGGDGGGGGPPDGGGDGDGGGPPGGGGGGGPPGGGGGGGGPPGGGGKKDTAPKDYGDKDFEDSGDDGGARYSEFFPELDYEEVGVMERERITKRFRDEAKKTKDGKKKSIDPETLKELKEQYHGRKRAAKKREATKQNLQNAEDLFKKDRFSLFRNLQDSMQTGPGTCSQKLRNWHDRYITPTEKNCVVRQVSQCVDNQRLEQLRQIIEEGAPSGDTVIRDYEIVHYANQKTAIFKSNVGRILGAIANLHKPNAKKTGTDEDTLLQELEGHKEAYAGIIKNTMVFVEANIDSDTFFPLEALDPEVREKVEKDGDIEDKEAALREIRRTVFNNIMQRAFGVSPREVGEAVEKLVHIAELNYTQRPSLKKLNRLRLECLDITTDMLQRLMWTYVAERTEMRLARDFFNNYLPNIQATNDPATQRAYESFYRRLFAEKLDESNLVFHRLFQREDWKRLVGAMIWADVIPPPYAFSTYIVGLYGNDFMEANLLMWPDRIAMSFDPAAGLLITTETTRRYIETDYLDPARRDYHTLRPNMMVNSDGRTVQSSILRKLINNSIVNFGEESDIVRLVRERYSPNDVRLFLDSARVPYEAHALYQDSSQKFPKGIPYFQFLNKIQRGLDVRYDPAGNEIVTGGWVYAKTTIDQLIPHDIFSDAAPVVRLFPTEFHFTSVDPRGEVTDPKGSFVYVRQHINPHLNPFGFQAGTSAISIYLDLLERKNRGRKNVWWKDRDRLRKKKDSNKQEKELKGGRFKGWYGKLLEIDVICEGPNENQWDYPDWLLLLFKALASFAYREADSTEYLLLVRLDNLKRFGNARENVVVFLLRKYLDFGVCIGNELQGDENNPAYYGGTDGPFYDFDYVIQEQKTTYSSLRTAADGTVYVDTKFLETNKTEPLLIRPMPTAPELWKLFQYYMRVFFSSVFGNEMIRSLYDFMYGDPTLPTGSMKRAKSSTVHPKRTGGEAERAQEGQQTKSKARKFSKVMDGRFETINPYDQDNVLQQVSVDEGLPPAPMEPTLVDVQVWLDASLNVRVEPDIQPARPSNRPAKVWPQTKSKGYGISIGLWRVLSRTEKKNLSDFFREISTTNSNVTAADLQKDIKKLVAELYRRHGKNPHNARPIHEDPLDDYNLPAFPSLAEVNNMNDEATRAAYNTIDRAYKAMDVLVTGHKIGSSKTKGQAGELNAAAMAEAREILEGVTATPPAEVREPLPLDQQRTGMLSNDDLRDLGIIDDQLWGRAA